MKIREKYLETLKIFTKFVTIYEWAVKFGETYPDELKKANKEAAKQKNDTTGLKKIEIEIQSSLISSGYFYGTVQVNDCEDPQKVKYIVLGDIFNRNIPVPKQYTIEEIKIAFSKTIYKDGTKKEQQLYNRFFIECANDELVKQLRTKYEIQKNELKKLYNSFDGNKKIKFGRFWEHLFRVRKNETIFSQIEIRYEGIYVEIDKFKLYELTPCIAYEMAIRNEDVKDILLKLELVSNMMNEDQYLYRRILGEDTFKNLQDKNLSDDYQNLTYEEYVKLVFVKRLSYSNYFNSKPAKFVHNFINMCSEFDLIQLKDLYKELENKLINDYLIYPSGYKRKIPYSALNHQEIMESLSSEELREIRDVQVNNEQACMPKIKPTQHYVQKKLNQCLETKIEYRNLHEENLEEVTNSQKIDQVNVSNVDSSKDIVFEKAAHEEFIQIQALSYDNESYSLNNIIPNFKRQVNDQNQIILPINFSLSLDEIIEYITKVHDKINPKSLSELLGQELNRASNLSNLNTINEKGEYISLDMISGKDPQKKLSDMLYVYDMREKGYYNKDIIDEVDACHGKTAYLRNHIHTYYDIAKDYIENERYKELITGKSEP